MLRQQLLVVLLLPPWFYGPWTLSGTTRESRYQKGKTNLDLLEQETVSGSTPHQHTATQFFTGRMPFLPPNQQHHSTEGSEHDWQTSDYCH